MISLQGTLILSPYIELYDILIPQNHLLRKLHDEIDYSFILKELEDKYSPDMGRPAEPLKLFKCLILKTMSDLSDEDLMEEIKMNMSYKFFLDMAPEDLPPDSSTLCKFRRQRLKDKNLMDLLLTRTIDIAEAKGLLKRSDLDGKFHVNVIIDGTHTVSAANLYRPIPALKEYSKRLRAQLYRCDETLKGKVERDCDISSTDLIGEVAYGKRLIAYVTDKLPHLFKIQSVKRVFNRFKELIDDIENHYNASVNDPDARVGHKSADTEFFGYKTQLAMDEESRLILGAEVTSGEVGDAEPGLKVLEDIAANDNYAVEEVLGDTAYSGQPILEFAQKNDIEVIAPPHPNLGTGIDGRDGFTFNKDADMFICPNGHLAIKKRNVIYKKDNNRKAVIYTFDPHKCAVCPLKENCLKGQKKKTFSVSKLTNEQRNLLQRCQTEEFKRRRRQRYRIEAKNAHLKQGLGFSTTKGKGIEMMELQAAVTFFVSNLKIIYAKK